MEHTIPAQGFHLRFAAPLDGRWHACPYPRPTASAWGQEGGKGAKRSGENGKRQPEVCFFSGLVMWECCAAPEPLFGGGRRVLWRAP